MSVKIYNILDAMHIEFFSFSLLLFLHVKLKTEITFGTIEQYSKGLVTQRPRRKADNGQENVTERKSNSI